MSTGLLSQIDAYFSALDTDQGPVSSDQVASLLDHVREVPVGAMPVPRKSRMWVAVAAFVAVIAVVGALAWLAPWGTGAPPADKPTVTSTSGPTVTSTSEPTVTSAVSKAVEVTWSREEWAYGEGPEHSTIVAASSFLLGTGRNGRLWRSSDGVNWEPILNELTGISLAGAEGLILVGGLRGDGTPVLLRSSDGSTWTEVDRSVVPAVGGRDVMATTPSGLTWFGPNAGHRVGEGVLAVVSGDRITEVHDPPWRPDTCCDVVDLIEVGGNIAAYAFSGNEPQFSHQWKYLGNGQWSEAMDAVFSTDHAVVGETVLMFDQTNATCCGNPISGTSFWPLLSSSDGISWTEVAQIPGDDVHTLHVNAGTSFWIYGPSIGGGGSAIEVNPDTTLGISWDGVTWQRIDISQVDATYIGEPRTGFVFVAGNTIFLTNLQGTDEVWVGTIVVE